MLADLLEKMNLEEKQICPALSEFRLTGWDGSVTVSELLELLKTEQFFAEWFISAASCAYTFGYNMGTRCTSNFKEGLGPLNTY